MIDKNKEKLDNQIISEALFELFSVNEEEVKVEFFQQFLLDKYFLDLYLKTKVDYKLEDVIDTVDETPKKDFRSALAAKKESPIQKVESLKNSEENKPQNFSDIIKSAKQNIKSIEEKSFTKPKSEEEELILKIAEERGQTEYDPEILRELILARQKNKRANSSTNNYFDNIRKRKDEYLK